MNYSILNSNKKLILFLKGALMGAADIVPGISGGTIALLVGIYDEFIESIANLDFKLLAKFKIKEFVKKVNWKFLVPLFSGIIFSIFLLSYLINWLLENHPLIIWSSFFGLVLTSAVFLINKYNSHKFPNILFLILGIVVGYILLGSFQLTFPNNYLGLLLAGMVASVAMILPGISGSYILVLIGMYQPIITAVKDLDLISIFFVAIGVATGLILSSRVIKKLLKKFPNQTYAVLFGFIIGSLQKIWPWKEAHNISLSSDIDTLRNIMAFFIMLTSGAIVLIVLRKPKVSS